MAIFKHIDIDGTSYDLPDVSKTQKGLCPQLPNETTTTKYLRQDGTWSVPPNSTYSLVSKTANGLCPQLPNETTTTKYLRQDGTWVVPPNTTYGVVSKTANGLCPQLPNEITTTKYLRQDGTWVVPPNTTYSVVSTSRNGLAPKVTDTTKYLRGDGTWSTPTNTTYDVVTTSANGLCPQLAGGTSKYLRADGTWVVPPNTTYSVVSKTANGLCPQLPNETTTTKYLRQDGTWVVPPNTTSGTSYAADSIPVNNTFGTNSTINNVRTELTNKITPEDYGSITTLNGTLSVNKSKHQLILVSASLVTSGGTAITYTTLVWSALLTSDRVYRIGGGYNGVNNDTVQFRWLNSENKFRVDDVKLGASNPASFTVFFTGVN